MLIFILAFFLLSIIERYYLLSQSTRIKTGDFGKAYSVKLYVI